MCPRCGSARGAGEDTALPLGLSPGELLVGILGGGTVEEGGTGSSPCCMSPSVTWREGKGGAGTPKESPGQLPLPPHTHIHPHPPHLRRGTSSSTTLLQTHPFRCGRFGASNTWKGERQRSCSTRPEKRHLLPWQPPLSVPAGPVPVPRSPELWSSWRRVERLLSCWGLSSGSPRP